MAKPYITSEEREEVNAGQQITKQDGIVCFVGKEGLPCHAMPHTQQHNFHG